jgi:hypothetical protein
MGAHAAPERMIMDVVKVSGEVGLWDPIRYWGSLGLSGDAGASSLYQVVQY